jgi:hypothetical protein
MTGDNSLHEAPVPMETEETPAEDSVPMETEEERPPTTPAASPTAAAAGDSTLVRVPSPPRSPSEASTLPVPTGPPSAELTSGSLQPEPVVPSEVSTTAPAVVATSQNRGRAPVRADSGNAASTPPGRCLNPASGALLLYCLSKQCLSSPLLLPLTLHSFLFLRRNQFSFGHASGSPGLSLQQLAVFW